MFADVLLACLHCWELPCGFAFSSTPFLRILHIICISLGPSSCTPTTFPPFSFQQPVLDTHGRPSHLLPPFQLSPIHAAAHIPTRAAPTYSTTIQHQPNLLGSHKVSTFSTNSAQLILSLGFELLPPLSLHLKQFFSRSRLCFTSSSFLETDLVCVSPQAVLC